MNAEQKFRANIKAAELLGLEYRIHDLSIVLSVRPLNTEKWRGFNIFDYSADCLSTVKRLGVTKRIDIVHVRSLFAGTPFESRNKWRWVMGGSDLKRYGALQDTYEEAVADALLGLK